MDRPRRADRRRPTARRVRRRAAHARRNRRRRTPRTCRGPCKGIHRPAVRAWPCRRCGAASGRSCCRRIASPPPDGSSQPPATLPRRRDGAQPRRETSRPPTRARARERHRRRAGSARRAGRRRRSRTTGRSPAHRTRQAGQVRACRRRARRPPRRGVPRPARRQRRATGRARAPGPTRSRATKHPAKPRTPDTDPGHRGPTGTGATWRRPHGWQPGSPRCRTSGARITHRAPVRKYHRRERSGQARLAIAGRASHENDPAAASPRLTPRSLEPRHLCVASDNREGLVQLDGQKPAGAAECTSFAPRFALIRQCGRNRLIGRDRFTEALDHRRAAVLERDSLELAGRVDDVPGDKHLTGDGLRAEPGCHVDRRPAIAIFDRHRFAEVDPYSHRYREVRMGGGLLGARQVDLQPGLHGLPGRGKRGERLVSAQPEHPATPCDNGVPGETREGHRQVRRSLVTTLAGKGRVTPDVADEERADLRVRGCSSVDRRFSTSMFVPPAASRASLGRGP